MQIGVLPPGEPGVFRSLLLPEAVDALARGEALTALGLTENGLALGAAAGYLENSQFQLISLYVAPAYRQRGGGRMLVDALLELLPGHAAGVTVRFTVTEELASGYCCRQLLIGSRMRRCLILRDVMRGPMR